jgi:hypothetical protein
LLLLIQSFKRFENLTAQFARSNRNAALGLGLERIFSHLMALVGDEGNATSFAGLVGGQINTF